MWWRVAALLVVVLASVYRIITYSNLVETTTIMEPLMPMLSRKKVLAEESVTNDTISSSNNNTNLLFTPPQVPSTIKFYLIPTPEITTDLLVQNNKNVSFYYDWQLNEESAEVWLHRGFETLMHHHRTMDPNQANVFLIPGYFHLARALLLKKKKKENNQVQEYIINTTSWIKRIYNKTMPHVILCPTWNPEISRQTGIAHFIQQLQQQEGFTNLYSVGFERNPSWQVLQPFQIIPIPYVVRPSLSRQELLQQAQQQQQPRKNDFVFYAGDNRKHAMEWSGCNRSMVLPLSNNNNMDVSLRSSKHRLSQDEYNMRMFTSDYCLILCGDTVTSRSLTSAVVYGCIPVQVGSRWKGLCEDPCRAGWGWTVSGNDYPHLPFTDSIQWNDYPQVNEAEFAKNPLATLEKMFVEFQHNKTRLRQEMLQHQLGWIYGWGNPVTSNEFGQATQYIWHSIVATLGLLE